jgi:Haem-binding domain
LNRYLRHMSMTSTDAPPTVATDGSTAARRRLRWVGIAVFTVGLLLLLMQVVPYGRAHANPPVRQEPTWDSAQTRALAVRACFDCHSNQTDWAWYTNVAPVSWLAQRDVDRGRRALNFSEWDRAQEGAREAAESVQKGSMPPRFYVPLHPEAQLSVTERQMLISGLSASSGGRNRERGGGD